MTEVEIGILFDQVKKHLPSFHTDYFMTDDTNTFWNGFARVFPTSWTKRLLCLWHVQRAMKKNALSKLKNKDLLDPFVRKVQEICLQRDRSVFVVKYTSLVKYLQDNGEHPLALYMENSWSGRVEQWAAFGRMGSCVNTSMLCERFHKALKHDIMEGKANVRIDSLLQILINLTVEKEESRIIMMERGVDEGRYRLQQHHRSHASAINKYCGREGLISTDGNGIWQVKDNNKVYHVQEQHCPCHEQCEEEGEEEIGRRVSIHSEDVPMIEHMHDGNVQDEHFIDEEEEEEEIEEVIVVDDDIENNENQPRRLSVDIRDECKDLNAQLLGPIFSNLWGTQQKMYARNYKKLFVEWRNLGDL
ncbi:hypothetical protein OESDEN_15865 [Oesophagostomum dentatum]|uniref:MULE transposase domain-containing protein n=1 Tax=Oesophagostomum dentatum TaxID=61180 RepID=A0A0B1SKJ9_OESDE|nr:hypothetical protein OESDEN_15865 [Oesophagostomum dentatum]